MADPSSSHTKSGEHVEYLCSNSAKRPSFPHDVMGAFRRLDPTSRISYHIRTVYLGRCSNFVCCSSLPLSPQLPRLISLLAAHLATTWQPPESRAEKTIVLVWRYSVLQGGDVGRESERRRTTAGERDGPLGKFSTSRASFTRQPFSCVPRTRKSPCYPFDQARRARFSGFSQDVDSGLRLLGGGVSIVAVE